LPERETAERRERAMVNMLDEEKEKREADAIRFLPLPNFSLR
jgi:hypothetical protein